MQDDDISSNWFCLLPGMLDQKKKNDTHKADADADADADVTQKDTNWGQ